MADGCGLLFLSVVGTLWAYLHRGYVWLSRITHCRGFGIQSPSAFAFVCHVVNERAPYYAYTPLKERFSHLDGMQRKRYRLYLRLANHLQPTAIYTVGASRNEARDAYWQAGCRKAQCHHVRLDSATTLPFAGKEQQVIVCTPPLSPAHPLYESLLLQAPAGLVWVVEHIHSNRTARRHWQQLVADERTGVTFDLYNCGIVFFDHLRPKQHYVVNF